NIIFLPEDSNVEARATEQEFTLPAADGGQDAWLFLAACWAVEALVWGFGFSFGVFQDYYNTPEPFVGASNIAVIVTSILFSLMMAMSSFCTTVSQLIATQGVLFGIGGCISYCPRVLYIDESFVQRKGTAYGIMWSAAGFGGVVLSLLLEARS
ncbi:putative Major facilitator superfamily domain-containing protein, partial [Seiridium cardinale]